MSHLSAINHQPSAMVLSQTDKPCLLSRLYFSSMRLFSAYVLLSVFTAVGATTMSGALALKNIPQAQGMYRMDNGSAFMK